ncbi:magnesium chelatase subunit H [Fulvimarina endophytica]|uniref:magnesium chelatase n=1 Tax=Fulvimarina endophytica TaxID=2293836 RepID=A0A371X6V8_9HYPH|nr:magnesium chelatase subunit H [Fulvimarina endophytica]RFC64943.1 magnesium chelatase subunit H [Fulvimarina endophytica]
MTPKPTLRAEGASGSAGPVSKESAGPRLVVVTLDSHMGGALSVARERLAAEIPGLVIGFHAATDFDRDPAAIDACIRDIEAADIVFASMLFMEPHIAPILPALKARRETCSAFFGILSAGEVVKLTRAGKLDMGREAGGVLKLLKKLKGDGKKDRPASGARQMTVLRRLPKILRFIPGTAQDLRAYFLTLQYWLGGSSENLTNLIRFLVSRYAPDRSALGADPLTAPEPIEYPNVGLYHPRLRGQIATRLESLPNRGQGANGTVGILVMRSYVLAGDTAHYDGVIEALEARGLKVVPAFASGLDSRPAIDAYFKTPDGKPAIDALVCLTGFSLVGGPAYNDADAAKTAMRELDVPLIAGQAIEFQSLEEWRASAAGLSPVEATMMVAIPEIDGAIGANVYGGRTAVAQPSGHRAMACDRGRAEMLAGRAARLVALRRKARAERVLAITIFNFPPNAGSVGTAAHLSVFESLFNTLKALKTEGYRVDVPASTDELREAILRGNAERTGTPVNVHAKIPAEDHLRRERHLAEIEAQWGPAPGRHQSDGASLFVYGRSFGNVFVGVQPAFGYEGDPMRLLFERGFAPTHAFSAYYRWLREDLRADAVLHFGTHGALEFMPGKQVGLGETCWPDRLIGDLPNVNLYAANNPSEGALAKRRANAVLVSHLTPPLAEAGLYKGLIDLKSSLDRLRRLEPEAEGEREDLLALVADQAGLLDLDFAPGETGIAALSAGLLELEATLIPNGLHVLGRPASREDRAGWLKAVAEAQIGTPITPESAMRIADGEAEGALRSEPAFASLAAEDPAKAKEVVETLRNLARDLTADHETPALMRALDGRYIEPVPGGDILRNPAVVPTGRNIHGFDPFRIPSAFAVEEGRRQADRLLERHAAGGGELPQTVALVLWGTDNLKTEGVSLSQALALMGAVPRFDSYGRLAGAKLLSLEELGRPRIDALVTLSGIFRDLLPLQSKLVAEAAWLAATADEPDEMNFVAKHARAHAAEAGCDIETACLRVFANADGAYGSNVNLMIDGGSWEEAGELANAYTRRKCFAIDRTGKTSERRALLTAAFKTVDLAYQNLESVELGVTTIDHYFDTLGGVSRAASEVRGRPVPVYIGDDTRGKGTVRTLEEQVALETRTRALNPKWIEGMLAHGYEGVRQIENHLTNTFGWSATTGQVSPWVYKRFAETFVLDAEMRERLAALNPTASARMAERLLEADERKFWRPSDAERAALLDASADLEDRLEGILPQPTDKHTKEMEAA